MTCMPSTGADQDRPTALIVGASRGLGHAMAAELLDRGWSVIGTVRDTTTRTPLHDLADRSHAQDGFGVWVVAEPALDQGVGLGDLGIEGHHLPRQLGHH